jgi:hypothetical protein
MRTATRRGALAVGIAGALVLVVLVANATLRDDEGGTDGPVTSLGEGWNGYPTAEVTGRLTLWTTAC